MRQFMTAVLEQRKDFTGSFASHPMETAWASEAIFFLTVENIAGNNAMLKARVQISVDGVNWVDEGTHFESITSIGTFFVKVNNFGGWLRLCGFTEMKECRFNLTIHLAIKE